MLSKNRRKENVGKTHNHHYHSKTAIAEEFPSSAYLAVGVVWFSYFVFYYLAMALIDHGAAATHLFEFASKSRVAH